MTQKNQIYAAILIGFTLISVCMVGCPVYNVWTAQKHGEAELRRASYNRQVAVQEAEAKEMAAIHLYSADTIRAHGIARSNEIIGKSLENNPLYLSWLWIDELSKQQNVIYVPTENSMPLLLQNKSKQDSLVAGKKHSD